MLHRLQMFIWYSVIVTLLLVLHYVATGFTLIVVDDGYKHMLGELEPRQTKVLDQRPSAVLSLEEYDVIAYRLSGGRTGRMFGQVLALPEEEVTVRGGQILVGGDPRGEKVPPALSVLKTGLIVPRETVLVTFPAHSADHVPLADRLVPYRDILGRIWMGK